MTILNQIFHFQRGAIFGMDARVALIIASILAATGGVTIMSRLERDKVDQTERHLIILREGILDDYSNTRLTTFAPSLDPLFLSGIVTETNAKTDAWGNNWHYYPLSDTVTVENTRITMQYAVLFSSGKDGVADSSQPYDAEDFANWEPANDDIGIKISSRDVELERLEEYRARGQLIVDRLATYESSRFLEGAGICGGSEAPEWCNDYQGKNHTQFNYYPRSELDTVEGVIYYSEASGNENVYMAGDVNDMRRLLADIGLPTTYAADPWGRVLFYDSNITDRENPPFTASICYSSVGSCF